MYYQAINSVTERDLPLGRASEISYKQAGSVSAQFPPDVHTPALILAIFTQNEKSTAAAAAHFLFLATPSELQAAPRELCH